MTNKLGIEERFVNLLSKDRYNHYDEGYSVTQLIDSPRRVQLLKRHRDEIEEDVVDVFQAFLGHMGHQVMEAAIDKPTVSREERLFSSVGDTVIHGTPDVYDAETGVISDYKTTSAWSAVFGSQIKKWTEQLNLYAWLLRQHGKEVRQLEIVAIIRDWVISKRNEQNYPNVPIYTIPISLWRQEAQEEFVTAQVEYHNMASDCGDDELPPCTSEEMWEKPSTWAVMKRGRKRAYRVYNTLLEAEYTMDMKDQYIQHRPGERTRCQNYCSINKWCNQYKEYCDGKNT